MRAPKVIILGIDGGTWKIIYPCIEKGLLPNISKMVKNGIFGNLTSTIPPVTAPAWTTFMTGVNPAKHAIFDFAYHPFNSYEIKYLCGGARKSKTIWRILTERDIKVGCFNVPMTFPPEKVLGFIISGLDTPYTSSEFIYPFPLKRELFSTFGGVPLDIHQLAHMRNDNIRDKILNSLKHQEEKRVEIASYLLKKYPVDVFMLVFNATDQVQHHFWHFTDPEHPLFDSNKFPKYGDSIIKIYQIVDRCIGWFLEKFPDSNFVLMSDHGFKALTNLRLRLNLLLSEAGLLHFKRNRNAMQIFIQRLYDKMRAYLPSHLKARLAAIFPSLREKVESFASLANIDWSKTWAFAWEFCPTSPNIYINSKDRFPEGKVDSKERSRILHIIEDMFSLLIDDKGQKIVPNLYIKEKTFNGPYIDLAPDIILDWWEGSFLVESSLNKKDIVNYVSSLKAGEEWSGIHDLNGIFVLYGNKITKSQKCNLNIVDLAPIILWLLEEPIPQEFEGSIPYQILEAYNFLSKPKKIDIKLAPEMSHTSYSLEEEDEVKQKLRNLGYL